MSTDKIDPSKKDAKISSADDLTKTTNKSDVELSEEELKRVSGGLGDIKGESSDRDHKID
jgi:bacteriocin-like protein